MPGGEPLRPGSLAAPPAFEGMSFVTEIPELPAAELSRQPWTDYLLTQVGTALDSTMLRVMAFIVNAMLVPQPEDLPAMRAAAALLLEGELGRDPRRFFAFLDQPAPSARVTERRRRTLDGGVVVRRKFAGEYRPFSAGQTDPAGAPGDDLALVEHWMHESQPPRATVLALHGFSMGRPRLDGWALFASQWYRRGVDVALMTLPFHGARAPRGARFSGERFASPNPGELAEAVRQAVYEIRLVTTWLRLQTGAPVGLLGLSLGGYLSALMAGLSDEPDFVITVVPPACMGDLAWRFLERNRTPSTPFSREELRAAYRVHSPLTYPLRVAKERVMIIAGRGDRIVPPEHPNALWHHWGQPQIYWFSGSHLAPFRRQRIAAVMAEHLESLGIL